MDNTDSNFYDKKLSVLFYTVLRSIKVLMGKALFELGFFQV